MSMYLESNYWSFTKERIYRYNTIRKIENKRP